MHSATTSQPPAPTFDPLASAIETDRIYFALGASVIAMDGAEIASLPEFSNDPAATVVQRVAADAIASIDQGWLARLESRLRELGTPFSRIYLDSQPTPADKHLAAAGYRSREEIAFYGMADCSEPGAYAFRTVATDADWQAKLNFHEETGQRPDGYQSTAAEWTRMERHRCAGGGMEALLCFAGDAVVGAINIIDDGHVIRAKNVISHPGYRRTGVASAMLAHLSDVALSRGRNGVCVFAIAGGAGEKLYASAGLRPIGVQIEWSKKLGNNG